MQRREPGRLRGSEATWSAVDCLGSLHLGLQRRGRVTLGGLRKLAAPHLQHEINNPMIHCYPLCTIFIMP